MNNKNRIDGVTRSVKIRQDNKCNTFYEQEIQF